jgi:hypothetical protein
LREILTEARSYTGDGYDWVIRHEETGLANPSIDQ